MSIFKIITSNCSRLYREENMLLKLYAMYTSWIILLRPPCTCSNYLTAAITPIRFVNWTSDVLQWNFLKVNFTNPFLLIICNIYIYIVMWIRCAILDGDSRNSAQYELCQSLSIENVSLNPSYMSYYETCESIYFNETNSKRILLLRNVIRY